LLTQGEVMQLAPEDELVLVSGMPPIRAKKLRYYEDRNFASRRLAPPALAPEADGYRDCPARRGDDWSGLIAQPLATVSTAQPGDAPDDGGRSLERHPGLPEERAVPVIPPQQLELAELDCEDWGVAADRHALDQARRLAPMVRAHGLNDGCAQDLLPGI
jgi:type IV secretion system protein VirD4